MTCANKEHEWVVTVSEPKHAITECKKCGLKIETPTIRRTPPTPGKYGIIELMESVSCPGHYAISTFVKDISAEQAREAAHLLNQLAEYLDASVTQ